MPTADSHTHLFALGFTGAPAGAPVPDGELVTYDRLRQTHRIKRALVLGYEGERRFAGNNKYVLAAARTHSWIAALAYLPVEPPPTVDQLRQLRVAGALGYVIYPSDGSDTRSLAAWPSQVIAEMNAQRAILSFNAPPAALARLAGFVDALHGCSILFSHLGLPGRFSRPLQARDARARLDPLLRLAPRQHVFVKFSALYGISDPSHDFPHLAARPFVEAILGTYGTHRLLWGSDFAPSLSSVSFAQTADTRLLRSCLPEEIDSVMGGNLLRLLSDRSTSEL